MPEYQFAMRDGTIRTIQRENGADVLSAEQIISKIRESLALFPVNVDVQIIENYEDIVKISFPHDEMSDIYICADGVLHGGRNTLRNELRVEPEARSINYVCDKIEQGNAKGFILGVYYWDDELIFCTWKANRSQAANPRTQCSKQIKVYTVAEAIREGFAQERKRGGNAFACALQPCFLYFFLKNCSWLNGEPIENLNDNYEDAEENVDVEETDELRYQANYYSEFPRNRIIFGAPGTGKSFCLNNERRILLEDGGTYERVTFHPDYSYANFVGTYKPVSNSNGEENDISYEYVPGPFMRVLVDSLKDCNARNPKPHLLLIEEINRANVAAVFGEVFQLLDRVDGVSEYPIQTSEDIRKYLAKSLDLPIENCAELRLPDNMFIWASMNSADQGVFPMDTAFKRRWDFTYIGINDNEDELVGKYVELGTGTFHKRIEWNSLRRSINNYLADVGINEDKQLGPYFLSKKIVLPENGNNIEPNKFINAFKNKVIMYLFEDAAKQKRKSLFSGCEGNRNRYSEICATFDHKGINVFNDEIVAQVRCEEPENTEAEGR